MRGFNRKWYQLPRMVMVDEQPKEAVVKKDTKKDPKKP
jgi:hypothetical protein